MKKAFKRHGKSSSKDTQHGGLHALRNAFFLPVVKKTVGITEGVHPSIFKGMGHDFEDFSPYQPGDNIKFIDWKATARSQSTIIKRFRANANTNMVFVVDSGKEMCTRSTSGERKIDVTSTICETFAQISTKRLDAVGIVAGDHSRIMNERAKLSLGEVSMMLKRVEKLASDTGPTRSYDRVLHYVSQYFQKRTFLVLIIDEVTTFNDAEAFASILRKLKERHDVFLITIRSINPFKQVLPNSNGRAIDISNHTYLPSFFRNEKLARITKKNITYNRNSLINNVKRIGIPHIDTLGSNDFYKKLAKIMQRREVSNLR
ncbi:MAG: DUF58 domain-containing protein [Candidatus Ancillula sp.]|jgi:uncharacterized protein (DUF58 family)|nr:DUF58 domain-containing protein [Candidatus Ancillula sp.]